MLRGRRLWDLLKRAADNWSSDQASTLGAALAFYCAFSLAPLLVILVALVGRIVGENVAYGYVASQLSTLLGTPSARIILTAVRSSQTHAGLIATLVSVATLLIGATTVFSVLELALEQMWGIETRAARGWRGFLGTRLVSLGVILAMGFLLLVSLSITTAVAALRGFIAQRYEAYVLMTEGFDALLSVAMSTCVVALIYQYVPARRVAWKEVFLGALVTALLFHAGRWAIGLYLGMSVEPSAFGAAASFVALLLWLYYSAQIFLFGAEFTACLTDAPRGVVGATVHSPSVAH